MSSFLGPGHGGTVFYGICHSLLAKHTLCPQRHHLSGRSNMPAVSFRFARAPGRSAERASGRFLRLIGVSYGDTRHPFFL